MNIKRNSRVISAIIIFTMILSSIITMGADNNVALASDVKDVSELATKAAKNNIDKFMQGTSVDGSFGNLGAYDVYILSEANVDVTSYVYEDKSLKQSVIDLADITIASPNDANAKNTAYEYLAMKSIGENGKANELLNILKGKQGDNGAFGYDIYTNMPTFDALGRAGVIGEINTQKAIEYILGEQNGEIGAWGAAQYVQDENGEWVLGEWGPDFMTSTQAVRSLIYLKDYATDVENVQAAIDAGISWIRSNQQNDGSFIYGWDDPLTDTSEVISLLDLLGKDLNTWKQEGKGPEDYLKTKALNEDGSFGQYKGITNNTWALDAYLKLGGSVDIITRDYVSYLATKAAKNNVDKFIEGTSVDGSFGNLGAYDVYMLSEAEVDVTSYVYEDKSLKQSVIDLADITIASPNDANAKNTAYEYLAMKSIGENGKANELLNILKGKQGDNGAFGYDIYTNMPTFDALGRAGVIGEINTQKAIEYILGEQNGEIGAWGAAQYVQDENGEWVLGEWGPDFMTSTQAVRSLIYLKDYATDVENVQAAIDAGISWIRSNQQNDGSFIYGWDDPLTDTSEVISLLDLLGKDLNTWKQEGKGPEDYLKTKALNEDGSFGQYKGITNNTWALDAYLKLEGVVDLSNYISDEDDSDDDPINIPVTDITVSIKVKGYNETIIPKTNLTIDDGDTVLNVLDDVLGDNDISYEISGGYVESIDGLAEFDKGDNSGWMVNVNGETLNVSSSDYELDDGDYIYWFYTSDYTEDNRNTDNPNYVEEIEEEKVSEAVDDVKEVLEDENEDNIVDAVDNLVDSFREQAKKIEDKEDAEKLYDYISDANDVIKDSLESIKSKKALEKFIEKCSINMGNTMLLIDKIEDEDKIEELADDMIEIALKVKEKSDIDNDATKTIESELNIDMSDGQSSIKLPAVLMNKINENNIDKVVVGTENATFKMSPKTFGEDEEDKEVQLKAEQVDNDDLSEDIKDQLAEGSVVVDLNVKVNDENVSEFKEPIEISMKYDADVEDDDKLTVFYLKDDGTIESVGGVYDSETKTVKFITNHLSKYFARENEKEFSDLEGVSWAESKIKAMAAKGIINGRVEGIFAPNDDITRAEFASLIVRMLKYTSKDKNMTFEDVRDNQWYYNSVKLAYENDLINGRNEKIFDPQGNITRQEMTKIIEKVLTKEGYKAIEDVNLDKFSDKSNIADWAKSSVALASREGIINGMGDGTFAPKQNANRAQAAVMLYKLYKLIMN